MTNQPIKLDPRPMHSSVTVSTADHPGDSQKVELLGRNRLIDELLRDDLEVALPIRDRGIDLIAYADLSSAVARYVARPIQMKAAWTRSFVIDRRYERIRDVIFAFVWHLGDRERATTFALTYPEAVQIGEAMGWTRTSSWNSGGAYSTSSPSAKLMALLAPHRMNPGSWWHLVTS
jgi:hypothetical protein